MSIRRTLMVPLVSVLLTAPGAFAQIEGVEPLARGPIHEAYANPIDAQPGPGQLVNREPPPPIEEIPADEKPDGDNVEWLPGYWAWDDARDDFVWVSGFWRVPPPGRSWVPGSWRPAGNGWQWTSGFWADAEDDDETHYLPPPPPSIESGPSTPAPGDDYIYTPGTFVYVSNRYVWRPGTWVLHRPGWVWIPPCYRWTPSGYLFVAGYWDYPLAARGCLYAPVWIDRRICYRPRWRYIPCHAVYDNALYGAMFVRPGFSHYYFGDYFEARFTTLGYRSWFSISIGRGYTYDPLFTYYRHTYRRDPHWAPAIREVYVARYAGHIPRPPVTVVNNVTHVTNINIINNPVVVNRYTNIVKSTNITNVTNVNNTVVNVRNIRTVNNQTTNVNNAVVQRFSSLKPVADTQKEVFIKNTRQVQEVGRKRIDVENQLAKRGAPMRENDLPRSVKLDVVKPTVRASARSGRPDDGKGPPPPAVNIKPTLQGRPERGDRPSTGAPRTGAPGDRPGRPDGANKPPASGASGDRPKPGMNNPPGDRPRPSTNPPAGDRPKPPGVNTPPSDRPKPPMTNPPAGGRPKPPVTNPPVGDRPKPPITPPRPPASSQSGGERPKPPTTPGRPPQDRPRPPASDRPRSPVNPNRPMLANSPAASRRSPATSANRPMVNAPARSGQLPPPGNRSSMGAKPAKGAADSKSKDRGNRANVKE